MKNIIFDDGIKEFMINNNPNRVLKFNPTDIGFIERLGDFKNEVEAKLNDIKNVKLTNTGDALAETEECINVVRDVNKALRDGFDRLFYAGASEIVFCNLNPIAQANGKTVLENFLNAIYDEIEPELIKQAKLKNERLNTYKQEYTKHKF